MQQCGPYLAGEGAEGVLEVAGPLGQPVQGVAAEPEVQAGIWVIALVLAAANARVCHRQVWEVPVDLGLVLLGTLEQLGPAVAGDIAVGHMQLQLLAAAAAEHALVEYLADSQHWRDAVASRGTAPLADVQCLTVFWREGTSSAAWASNGLHLSTETP